jgi:hypothetical protein
MARTERVSTDRTVTALEHACRSAIGDRLRSVTLLTPDGRHQVYQRSDLAPEADEAAHADAVPTGAAVADGGRATWTFDEGYVTRIRTGETGVVVTTDGLKMDRGTELSAVVRGILNQTE